MGFIFTNSVDGQAVTIAAGESVRFTFPTNTTNNNFSPSHAIVIQGEDHATPADESEQAELMNRASWVLTGDLQGNITSRWKYGSAFWIYPGAVVTFNLQGLPPGTYRQTVVFGDTDGAVIILRVILDLIAFELYTPPLTWLDAGLIDLQFEMGTNRLSSAGISFRANALTVGSTPTFAVIPTIAGVILETDVTSVSLVIRRKNQYDEEKLLEIVDASPSFEDVATDGYYALTGAIEGDAISEAFANLNSEAVDQNNPDKKQKLECLAQLSVTHDGAVYVSAPFALWLIQPLDETVLE